MKNFSMKLKKRVEILRLAEGPGEAAAETGG